MENVSLEGLLRQYITNSVNSVFTAIPARIVGNVNLEEQRVDVQIVIDKITTDNESRHHPVILNVPVIFPGSRTSQFSFPVSVGDTVLCIFSQRSLDRFKLGSNNTHAPLDFRKYSRADAMAIPGLFTFPDAVNDPDKHSLNHSTEDTVIVHNIGSGSECEVRLKASGQVQVNSPSDLEVNINGNTVLTLSDSRAAFNVPLTAPKITTDAGIDLDTHVHGGVQSGSSNTGVPS